jgi:hypothetical protein
MDRIYNFVTVLFLLAIPFWYVPVMYHDLSHPELWNDWMHDPRLYLPVLGVVLLCCVAFGVRNRCIRSREQGENLQALAKERGRER